MATATTEPRTGEPTRSAALALEEQAWNLSQSAERALRDAYRAGYIQGYLDRAVDEDDGSPTD